MGKGKTAKRKPEKETQNKQDGRIFQNKSIRYFTQWWLTVSNADG